MTLSVFDDCRGRAMAEAGGEQDFEVCALNEVFQRHLNWGCCQKEMGRCP